VVVAVCGTDASRGALLWGAQEAALRGADLVVVHAWQALLAGREARQGSTAVPAHGRAAADRLQEWVHQSLGRDDVELHAPRGGPLDEMLEASQDADLVVVGRSRPHAGLGRVLHGALGNDLCGLAPCPVVVVPLAG
jgi:nucleotide-binding universal stress UspA family protein